MSEDATHPAPNPINLPREVGGYEIQRVLGSGGMATVYAALQKQPRRTVAIKVMRGAVNAEAAMHRFKREIEILGRLRHPFIAQVYAAGVHEDGGLSVPYFVMEYVPGARTIIAFAEGRELNLRERIKLFIKVCAAVEHGHRHKIIHRDLKPGNILIDEAGEPKVIDFGVARAVEPDVTSTTMQTEEGRLIGTLQYMAPEQLETTRQDLDGRCDVYALGVLLYKLLTGRPPHDLVGLPVFTAAQVIREDPPPRPSSIAPEVKGDVETIILRALAKDKMRRYANAGSLGRDLVRYLAAKPIKARQASRVYRFGLFLQRHRSESRAAAIVVVVVIAAVAVVLWQRSTLDRSNPAAAPPAAAAGVTGAGAGSGPGALSPRDAETAGRAAPVAIEVPNPVAIGRPDDQTTALAFGPDEILLVQATEDRNIRFWDFETEETLFSKSDHDDAVRQVVFSGDGSRLASATTDEVVVLGRDGAFVRRLRYPDLLAMAIDRGGATLALTRADLTLLIVGVDGTVRHTMRSGDGAFGAVAFGRDGRVVAAGSEGGTVYVWDATRGGETHRFRNLGGRIVGLGFSGDAEHVVAVTENGNGAVLELSGARAQRVSFVVDVDVVHAMTVDATGEWIACASGDQVHIFALPSGEIVDYVAAPEGARITAIALYPGAYWVATAREAGGVHVIPIAERWTSE